MIKVNKLQKGNGLMGFMKANYVYEDGLTCDFEINKKISVLFLSIKFYVSHPEYILKRITKLGDYKLNVVMVLLDATNFEHTLRELYRIIPSTIVCCKNYEECANYIKNFSVAEQNITDICSVKEKTVNNFLCALLKTKENNFACFKSKYKNIKDILLSNQTEFEKIPGISKQKAKSMENFLDKSFVNKQ